MKTTTNDVLNIYLRQRGKYIILYDTATVEEEEKEL